MMRFEIPYSYTAEYLLQRSRSVRSAVLAGTVYVDVEEVLTPGEPAFEVGHDPGSEGGLAWRRFPLFDDRPARAWRVDRQLFVEYCPVELFVSMVLEPANNPFDVRAASGVSAIPISESDRPLITTREEVSGRGLVREWTDDLCSEKAEVIARRAGSMRVVGGMVCVPVTDPLVAVATPRPGVAVVGISESFDVAPNGFIGRSEAWHTRRYRLEELEAAEQYASRQSGERYGRLAISRYSTDRIFFPQECEHLYQDALTVASMLGGEIEWQDTEVVAAWTELQQILAQCPPGHVVPRLVPVLLDLISKVEGMPRSRSLGRGRRARFQREFYMYFDRELANLRTSISRWEDRPRTDEEWCDNAQPVALFGGVCQVLSSFQMMHVSRVIQVRHKPLMNAQKGGRVIVHYASEGGASFVAILSSELEIEEVIGLGGDKRSGPKETALLLEFISVNRRKARAEDVLATLRV